MFLILSELILICRAETSNQCMCTLTSMYNLCVALHKCMCKFACCYIHITALWM